ncbi:hypothetical protein B9Z55_003519 [Caenorhabditis nigoni]|uniref:C-type lectin domain-containing protein n=2 Tax=Caenorhabditis nigoni TaxID=1611254 RepID=A0A2G5VQP2_9PELO|nr:hypothetical protein B9Z55_003519 [Caenorhabditis nigoni]
MNDRFKKMMVLLVVVILLLTGIIVTLLVVLLHHGSSDGTATTSKNAPISTPTHTTTKIPTTTTTRIATQKLDITSTKQEVTSTVETTVTSSGNTETTYPTTHCQGTTSVYLNQFQSYDDFANGISQDLRSVSYYEESYLSIGLQAAEQLFNFQSFNTIRDHYKKIVIVYASTYEGTGELDPVPVANRLTEDGVSIITVAYDQGGGPLYKLAEIATPGMAFNRSGSSSIDVVSNIQTSLLQVNCFCPDGWEQYRTSFSDRFSFHYGQCLKVVTIPATWNDSRIACRNRMTDSYLATEQSQEKHDFILDYVKNQEGMDTPYKYNIGLSWSTTQNWWNWWVWEQPAGMTPVPNSFYTNFYTNWGDGWPIVGSPMIGVQNVQSGTQSYWQNILQATGSFPYVCEVYSCDTDNYCCADD